MGLDYHTRGHRIEEQIRLLRALWSEPLVNLEGKYERVAHLGIEPRPGREIPIWMGGSAPAVLDRVGRLADGWVGDAPNSAEFSSRLERIRAAAREAARDAAKLGVRASVSVTRTPVEKQVAFTQRWGQLGATHCTLNSMDAGFTSAGEHIQAARAFMEAYRGS
jgi:alkanesulfonate monooxygenase SsuD/methylene tetrahydromethanopterin reductase-like flavin-dependent oxidoreductase (luciferase family)